MNMSALQSFRLHLLLLLIIISSVVVVFVDGTVRSERKAYIVYMGEKREHEDLICLKHANMIERVARGDNVGSDLLIHSYKRSFDGFAAMLTEEEAQQTGCSIQHHIRNVHVMTARDRCCRVREILSSSLVSCRDKVRSHDNSPVANPDAEFVYGSGNIDPVKALNPGLVYDASESDYINFLCELRYNTTMLRMITGDRTACTKLRKGHVWDLNYPSFSLPTKTQHYGRAFWRTVTNVGPPSKYVAKVTMPKGVDISVSPDILYFNRPNQRTFKVVVSREIRADAVSGSLAWDDGAHHVKRPIVIFNTS